MHVEFIKMHGLGNDFIVLDSPARDGLPLSPAQLRALADRHRGIGFDQALVLEPPRSSGTLAYYRNFNADGSEVEQCGNGVRCLAELLRLRGKAHNGKLTLEGPAGRMHAELGAPGIVAVDMESRRFLPSPWPSTRRASTDRTTALMLRGRLRCLPLPPWAIPMQSSRCPMWPPRQSRPWALRWSPIHASRVA
jgi:diaminopimelate epimerase